MPTDPLPEDVDPNAFNTDPKHEKHRAHLDVLVEGSIARVAKKAQEKAEKEKQEKKAKSGLPWPFNLFSGE